MSGITFQVETQRVLQLLTKEIYDSPLAMLRENVQNAYDAIRMRFGVSAALAQQGRIDIRIAERSISVADNGIGMTEEVLKNNFWKAGSSGKNSEAARRAGVVGTFGIGAMANFGVCDSLKVETRAEGALEVLQSIAEKASLRIGEDCISLSPIDSNREIGTTVTATLDPAYTIPVDQARAYLDLYIGLLPVPVYLNDLLVSGAELTSKLPTGGRAFTSVGTTLLSDNLCSGEFEIWVDSNGQVRALVTNMTLAGSEIDGSMALLQAGGQLMGLRSRFGLAPIPASGPYQFGGFADLSFLQPTAGREALSRESIEIAARLVGLAERATSEVLATTTWADRNNAFLQWVTNNSRIELADHVTIHCLPDGLDMELCSVPIATKDRIVQYYAGNDRHVLNTFANQQSTLLQVSSNNPRRQVQLHYLQQRLNVPQVPDAAQITHVYRGSELTAAEASVLLRIASVLRDDYLLVDADVAFADISHGVTLLPELADERLVLYVSRSSSHLPALLEFYATAYEVFGQFIKDFVRVSIYPNIQQYVPSSTRGGVDALRKLLERNRELFRYEEADRGGLEGLLGDYLLNNASLTDVIKAARSAAQGQSQTVSVEQVGSIEAVLPDVVNSPIVPLPSDGAEFVASPPILREDVTSDLKILIADQRHPQLNSFTILLGLSDRLMKSEAEFFRTPHTTRIMWGGHRVIYIFTEATGRLSLYYDIELREPLVRTKTGGGMFPTTTLITKRRIFVPIPDAIVEEFRVTAGPKEFFVRFDILSV